MPKKGSDELFRLIKSLDSAEKAYFRKFAERHVIGEKNNYLKLFDAIEVQEVYDEKLLKGASYIKQLPYLKNYLFDMILKAMLLYHVDSTIESRLQALLAHVELLFRKGLYEACEKMIKKGKELCARHENNFYAVKFLYFEGNLMLRDAKKLFTEKKSKPINTQIIGLLDAEKNIIQYLDLQSRVVEGLHEAKKQPGPVQKEKLAHLMSDPLLQDVKRALSLTAEALFYNTWAFYAYGTYDYEQFYKYTRKHVAVRKKEFSVSGNVDRYVKALNNFCQSCLHVERYSECEQVLDEMKTLPVKTIDEEVAVYSRLMDLKFQLCIKTGNFAEGAHFADAMKPRFEKLRALFDVRHRTNLMYKQFQVYFTAGEYKKSLHWLNELLTDEVRTMLPERYTKALVQNLMLHYEMKNYEVIPHLLRSLKRQIGKKDTKTGFEYAMIDGLNDVVIKGRDEKLAWAEAKEKLRAAFADPAYEKYVQEDFDFISWLESRIEKRPFAAVIKSKITAEKRSGKKIRA